MDPPPLVAPVAAILRSPLAAALLVIEIVGSVGSDCFYSTPPHSCPPGDQQGTSMQGCEPAMPRASPPSSSERWWQVSPVKDGGRFLSLRAAKQRVGLAPDAAHCVIQAKPALLVNVCEILVAVFFRQRSTCICIAPPTWFLKFQGAAPPSLLNTLEPYRASFHALHQRVGDHASVDAAAALLEPRVDRKDELSPPPHSCSVRVGGRGASGEPTRPPRASVSSGFGQVNPPVAGGRHHESLLAGSAVVIGAALLAARVMLVVAVFSVLAAVVFRQHSTCLAPSLPSASLPRSRVMPQGRRFSLYLAFCIVLLVAPGAQGFFFRIVEEEGQQGLDLSEGLRHRALTDGTF